jgi:hypothetical protein
MDEHQEAHQHATKICRMVLCSIEPLFMDTVKPAVAFNEDDKRFITDAYVRKL